MSGERCLANANSNIREVHDLENERLACQVDEISRAGHDHPYHTLFAAHADGYGNCAHCIGGSS